MSHLEFLFYIGLTIPSFYNFRRMFPSLRVQLSDLDPNSYYCVLLEMVPASNCRYKYSASLGWTAAGNEEAHSPHRLYLHPESPASGEHWMSQPVSLVVEVFLNGHYYKMSLETVLIFKCFSYSDKLFFIVCHKLI